jgi:hypothetical protein
VQVFEDNAFAALDMAEAWEEVGPKKKRGGRPRGGQQRRKAKG